MPSSNEIVPGAKEEDRVSRSDACALQSPSMIQPNNVMRAAEIGNRLTICFGMLFSRSIRAGNKYLCFTFIKPIGWGTDSVALRI